jgi:hypothetical protein
VGANEGAPCASSAQLVFLCARLRQFELCASGILNPDNTVRKNAEAVLDRLQAASNDKYMLLLSQALMQSKSLEVRQFCAVVLRQVCVLALFARFSLVSDPRFLLSPP